jgi:hypothetical protein
LETYAKHDDVFRWEFLSGIILVGASKSDVEMTDGARNFLESLGNEWIEWVENGSQQVQIPLGPVAFVNGKFTSILRLFDDSRKAFVVAVKPSVQGLYHLFHILFQELTIAKNIL